MNIRAVCSVLVALVVFAPASAFAFCGFYVGGGEDALVNDATQVIMMRQGERTVLNMRNDYKGPPEDFAMVVPVPVVLQEEHVKTLDDSVFTTIERMAAPRLVEYWEQDPCPQAYDPIEYMDSPVGFAVPKSAPVDTASGPPPSVVVEAQFKVGEYEIVILSATESGALDTWLRTEGYNIPAGAGDVLRPYVEQGMYFFVAKVDAKKVSFVEGRARLSPLRFHYDSEEFSLPIRLGMLNADGAQDLIVHILALGQRYEAANYKNVTVPTNLGVTDDTRERFGEFYAALFDKTLERNPGAVVTEYAWQWPDFQNGPKCDPCPPGPSIGWGPLQALGADVTQAGQRWDYVLTRIHARYDKETLGDDIVFRAAPPIVGGREHIVSENGELEEGAQPSGMNQFQGRYIIRHPWEGAIACDNPVRGVWGGPPGGGSSVTAATDTALAPRGELELVAHLRTPVPELDIAQGALHSVSGQELTVPSGPEFHGCGACATREPRGVAWAALALLGLAGIVWRRRS
jgi:MYXO-CTERM domain-containing protein